MAARFKDGHELLVDDLCRRWSATLPNEANVRQVQKVMYFIVI